MFPQSYPIAPPDPALPPNPFQDVRRRELASQAQFGATPEGMMPDTPPPVLPPGPQPASPTFAFPKWDAPPAPPAPPTATDAYLRQLQAKPGSPEGAPIAPGTPGGPSIPWYKKIGAAALGATGAISSALAQTRTGRPSITPEQIAGAQQGILQGDFPARQAQYAQGLKQVGAAAEQEQSATKARMDAESKQSQIGLQAAQTSQANATADYQRSQAGAREAMLPVPQEFQAALGVTSLPAATYNVIIPALTNAKRGQVVAPGGTLVQGGQAVYSAPPAERAPAARNAGLEAQDSWVATHPGKTAADYQIMLRGISSTSGDVSSLPDVAGAADPAAHEILGQTGLSMNAFRYIIGQASQLPRDKVTRNKASLEAQNFAKARGVDISTLPSQYNTYNHVLAFNITRQSMAAVQEQEIQGTIQNLMSVADDASLHSLRWGNVLKIMSGQEVNDPTAQQYAFHLEQLRSEIVAYNLIAQGQVNSDGSLKQSDEGDLRRAEATIKKGIDSGSLRGLENSVRNSTAKMTPVLQRSVESSRKAVWTLFGVGGNYKDTTSPNPVIDSASGTAQSGMTKVQIPGHPPDFIPTVNVAGFRAKYPQGKVF